MSKMLWDSRVKGFVPAEQARSQARPTAKVDTSVPVKAAPVPYNFLTDPSYVNPTVGPRSQIDRSVSGLGAYRSIRGKNVSVPGTALTVRLNDNQKARVKDTGVTAIHDAL
jgi:hypothetical protein